MLSDAPDLNVPTAFLVAVAVLVWIVLGVVVVVQRRRRATRARHLEEDIAIVFSRTEVCALARVLDRQAVYHPLDIRDSLIAQKRIMTEAARIVAEERAQRR